MTIRNVLSLWNCHLRKIRYCFVPFLNSRYFGHLGYCFLGLDFGLPCSNKNLVLFENWKYFVLGDSKGSEIFFWSVGFNFVGGFECWRKIEVVKLVVGFLVSIHKNIGLSHEMCKGKAQLLLWAFFLLLSTHK